MICARISLIILIIVSSNNMIDFKRYLKYNKVKKLCAE